MVKASYFPIDVSVDERIIDKSGQRGVGVEYLSRRWREPVIVHDALSKHTTHTGAGVSYTQTPTINSPVQT